MNYKSKSMIVTLAVGIAVLVAYAIYIATGNAPSQDDIKEWAVLMLKFIAVAVIATIVGQIIFHIVLAAGFAARNNDITGKETERMIKSESIEDERDVQISAKSLRIGYVMVGIGFVSMLFMLAAEQSFAAALNAIFIFSLAGGIAEGVVSVCLYERGIRRVGCDG